MIYQKFLVRDQDHYIPYQFQHVESEIENIYAELAPLPGDDKAEMLISYCKTGSIKTEDAASNPELAKRVETLPVTSIAELFACCAGNATFRKELEEHLRERLNAVVNLKS